MALQGGRGGKISTRSRQGRKAVESRSDRLPLCLDRIVPTAVVGGVDNLVTIVHALRYYEAKSTPGFFPLLRPKILDGLVVEIVLGVLLLALRCFLRIPR